MFVMSSKKYKIKKTRSTAFSSLTSNHIASSSISSTGNSSSLDTSNSLQALQTICKHFTTSHKRKNTTASHTRKSVYCLSDNDIFFDGLRNISPNVEWSSVVSRKISAASTSIAIRRLCSLMTSQWSHGYWYRVVKNVGRVIVLTVVWFLVFGAIQNVSASEFPERECCDPIYPVITSTAPPPPSAVTVPVGKTGLNVRTSIAILNCLLARQLCFEDASCSAILEIIPRVCGSELVACSTVTVTKCQAALRTLQAFPFFKPTCLCREPNVDPECNSFRDFLFDHPCVFVLKKEKDPYPVEALPTCNYALNVCHSEKSCASLFDTFKAACRARDGDCRMDDREQCREAWTGLRMSPLFGCICPNNHMKKRCDRIFAMVNHNPCVEVRLSRGDPDLFLSRILRLRHTPRRPPPSPPSDRHPDRFNLHPSKLPESSSTADHAKKATKTISLEYKSNITRYLAPDGTILLVTENGTQVIIDSGGGDLIRAIIKAMGHRSRVHSSGARRNHDLTQRTRHQPVNAVSPDGKKITPNKTSSNAVDWVAGADIIQELEIDDNYVSPHIMEEGHRRLFGRPGTRKGGTHGKAGHGHSDGTKRIGTGGGNDGGADGHETKITLRSTCHLALDRCIRDKSCTTALTPVLQACDASRCDREGCMEALRNFYRTPNVQWNLEIAFCLCKKTDNKEDPCMNAQEKLHPVCAQREPGAPLPACHVLAQSCREQPDCRSRLEFYEQSCAVDSVTKKCAGSADACRGAVLDMLGTELRTACACKGTDYTQLYDCLGWQRLLWLNPCVVESQSDFHIKTYGSGSTPSMLDSVKTVHISEPEIVTYRTTTPFIMRVHPTTPSTTTILIPVETLPTIYSNNIEISSNGMKNGRNIEVEIQGSKTAVSIYGAKPDREVTTTTEMVVVIVEDTTTTTTVPTTTETTTPTTTTSTTTQEPVKYCIVQRPELDDQFVQKGHTRRLYRDAELDCSELCHCDIQLSVSCHAVCVRHAPCRTALAFYSHAAPAYQAYRGRCYCYSGSFICMRPNPGEYSLPPGVYLLLGFSSQDEALLRPHTRLGLEDAVRVLQEYMLTLADEATNCTLTLFNVTNENMIVTAGIPPSLKDKNTNVLATLDTDKMECIGLLESIKSKINTQDYDISSHLLLSIFKIAEVDVVYPPPSSAYICRPCPMAMLLAFALLIVYNGRDYRNVWNQKNENSLKRRGNIREKISDISLTRQKRGSCIKNDSSFQNGESRENGRRVLNIMATALSVLHALSLTLIVKTCTNISRICRIVVLNVLKYFIHKLMLETIAHFFYFVNRILLIIVMKMNTVFCPSEIFSKSTFSYLENITTKLFLVIRSPTNELIKEDKCFYCDYIKKVESSLNFDRLIFKVYQIHINLAVNIKGMIKNEKKLLLFIIINGCNRIRKNLSKLRAIDADGNLVNFVVVAFINSARPKTDVFLLLFYNEFIGVHYEYNIHTCLPIFLKHIDYFIVYDFRGYSRAAIFNGALKNKETLNILNGNEKYSNIIKQSNENFKKNAVQVNKPRQNFICDKIFHDTIFISDTIDSPFYKMANSRHIFVR